MKSMKKKRVGLKSDTGCHALAGWLYFLSVLILAGWVIPAGSAAEETEKKIYKLDDIVISTSRNEVAVQDVAQSVTVLSSEQIMASPFERVEDIIRALPGVYNTRHYGTQTSGISNPITVRGVGGNRVLLLVDGVPQNDNFNNSIAWVAWGHIPKEAIERIEVVRGPSSAMYGSEGIGGVIHIITKTPKTQRKTSVKAEAGTSDTWAGQGFHSQKSDDLGILVAGGYEESDGFYMMEHPEPYNTKRHREVGKVMGKVGYDLDDKSSLTVSGLYYDHESGKGREFFYDELQLGQYAVNYSRTTDAGFDLKALAYYNQADKTAYQDTAKDKFATLFRYEEAPSENWGLDLQGSLPLGKSAVLTVGTTYREISWDYDNNYIGSVRDEGAEGTQRFVSPFFNADMKFLEERLVINLGARYDWMETTDGKNWDSSPSGGKESYDRSYDDASNNSFSPKIGLTFHPDNRTVLRASAGKGFRAPSLFELFKVHVRRGGTYYREANPDLDPEEIWAWDLGVERVFMNNLRGSITYYQSYADDYIGTRTTRTYEKKGSTYKEYVLDNISEVEMYGIETELNWYPTSFLMIFGNYTWNVSEITKNDADPFEEGLYLTNDPRHKFHVGATYQNPKFINATVIWNRYLDKYYSVDETTQAKDDFWSLDLSVSRRFFDRATAYLNVENIFDSVDNEGIAPGTIYTGGVKFEF
ncbi:MAG: TonB-dependent receptor [Desulfobacteraceae bacterium]